MKKNKFLFLAIVMFFQSFIFSQEVKFGKIDKDLFENDSHPLESDASAALLYNESKTHIKYNNSKSKFQKIIEVYKRFKIFTAEGEKYGEFVIHLYSEDSNDEDLSKIEATSYNLVNSKVVKSKLDKKSIYKERVNKFWKSVKFAIPNVKPGSIIEIKYKIISPYLHSIPQINLQYDIPVDKNYHTVRTPEYFRYNTNSKGAIQINRESKNKNASIKYSYVVDESNNPLTVKRVRKYSSIKFIENQIIYRQENVPSLKEEPFVTDMDNYRSSISMDLLSVNWPQEPIKYYNKSWDDIAINLSKSSSFGKQLNKEYKELKSLIKSLEDMGDEQKIITAYEYVKSTFTWNGNNSIYTDEGIAGLIEKRTGNNSEMNLLLVNILRNAGIQAYPVIGKTRTSGFINIIAPSLSELNNVLAMVNLGDKKIYMDATEKLIPLGLLPPKSLNLRGVIINKSSGRLIEISNPNTSLSQCMMQYSLNQDGTLSGKRSVKFTRYESFKKRNEIANYDDIEEWNNSRAEQKLLTILDSEALNVDSIYKDLKLQEEIETDNYTQDIAGKIFLNATLDFGYNENIFTAETREFPIFLESTSNNTNVALIELDEGITVESLPEPTIITIPENKLYYSYTVKDLGGKIQINSSLKFNDAFISPEYYPYVKELFDLIVKKSNEKIVLVVEN